MTRTSIRKETKTARPARARRTTKAMSGKPASDHKEPQPLTKLDWVERELAKRPPRSEASKADDEPATLGANTDQEADGRNLIREMAKIEWGVAYERGGITACESEQAARQLQAASGGELVYRRTWITTWSSGSPLPAREARPPARAAIPGSV
jgi:hypothetical protein